MMGLAFILAGCATVHKPVAPAEAPAPGVVSKPADSRRVKHKVHKGETLWRIAKTYGVSIDDIIQANGIPNAASIELNQLIFIPGVAALKDVSVVSPSGKDVDYAWPVKGKVMAYFGDVRRGVANAGIDVSAVEGEVVKAAREGRVVLADRLPGNGYAVILDHGDGFFTVYAHNERLMVKLADYVLKGENLAQVAREGNLAYLHFEVRKGEKPTNPLYYLP
ncbi:MAG: peptidoglycan DD-metalloendopeptidase family protein [Candidatus Omnitrophota bacterium]